MRRAPAGRRGSRGSCSAAGDRVAGSCSRLEVERAARVEMEGRVLDEREIARPAVVRCAFRDRLTTPALDLRVDADELVEAERLPDPRAQLRGHGLDGCEQARVSARVALL